MGFLYLSNYQIFFGKTIKISSELLVAHKARSLALSLLISLFIFLSLSATASSAAAAATAQQLHLLMPQGALKSTLYLFVLFDIYISAAVSLSLSPPLSHTISLTRSISLFIIPSRSLSHLRTFCNLRRSTSDTTSDATVAIQRRGRQWGRGGEAR